MKKVFHLRFVLLFSVLFLFFTACQKEKQEPILLEEATATELENIVVPDDGSMLAGNLAGRPKYINCNTFYGPQVQMGNGHIRSWININKSDKKPIAIGIEFTHKSFDELPIDPENHAAGTFVLKLHSKAISSTPFDHIVVNWEPNGHEPAGIYNVPHFDMHFYKISMAEQAAIGPVAGPVPPSGYLPASYVIEAATVPQMGTHWLDPSSPELPPTFIPFTHTFIYGATNGKVIFLEPMITRALMLSGTSVVKPFPQPTLFAPTGTNYPTVYRIWKNAENSKHYVALTDFLLR